MNSDSEDEEILSDIELTAEELAEAEASLAAKHAKSKSTGDIVVPVDVTTETKKVCDYTKEVSMILSFDVYPLASGHGLCHIVRLNSEDFSKFFL